MGGGTPRQPRTSAAKARRPVARRRLPRRIHLAVGLGLAMRLKHRVVAEAPRATRRPHPLAFDTPLEQLEMPIRPGEAKHGYEIGAVIPGRSDLGTHALHGGGEVTRRAGPARRIDAGCAIQSADAEAAVIRQRRQAARPGCRLRLQPRIAGEGRLRLIRLGKPEVTGRHHMDIPGLQQRPDLGELPRIVACQHQPRPRLEGAGHQATFPAAASIALVWATNSSRVPALARLIKARQSASEKGAFSAVA